MALSKIFHSIANTKTRTMLLFSGTLVAVGIGIAATQLGGEDTQQTQGAASTPPVPSSIKAVPGNATPEQYQKLLQEDNRKRAEEAKRDKTSAIATLIGSKADAQFDGEFQGGNGANQSGSDFGNTREGGFFGNSIFSNNQARIQQEAQNQQNQIAAQQARVDAAKRAKQEEEERNRLARERATQQKNHQAAVDRIGQAMEGQTKAVFAAWGNIPQQSYVSGILAPTAEDVLDAHNAGKPEYTTVTLEDGTEVTVEAGQAAPAATETIKAGSVLFAVLDTGINSDEISPVMASVVQGPYKGAKLIGAVKKEQNAEKVTVTFNTMSLPDKDASIPVQMVAIDPDTARTALASDVDHHYLLRYGALFASSFMEGYGKAVKEAGSVQTNNPGTNTTTTTSRNLSGEEEVYAALGTVGEKWSKQAAPTFNRPPTVTVDAGIGIGLLVLTDIKVN